MAYSIDAKETTAQNIGDVPKRFEKSLVDPFVPLGADAPARVLVVEDDPVFARVLQRLFRDRGIVVDHASDGATALTMHRQHPYRLVVSDWMMPGMDGVSLCRAFRQLQGSYTYFILCSARGEKQDRMEAFDAGVDDFLGKPLDREELSARLKVAARLLASEDILQRQKEAFREVADDLAVTNGNLALVSSRFAELFDGLPVGCFTCDEKGCVREWNRVAEQIFGIATKDALGQIVTDLFGAESPWRADLLRRAFRQEQLPAFDWVHTRPDGETRYLSCHLIGLPGSDGGSPEAVCANVDITERKKAEQRVEQQVSQINAMMQELRKRQEQLEAMNLQLEHLATTDGLTGLINHRRFHETLHEGMERHVRLHEPFSLLLLDIDSFKLLNDRFGHPAGDEVLRRFADVLRRVARKHEQPARYGGEEFAIILNGCGKADAMMAAERFRAAIEAEKWDLRNVTSSFGVSTWEFTPLTVEEMISQADKALYASKQAGKNRVSHFEDLDADVLRTGDYGEEQNEILPTAF